MTPPRSMSPARITGTSAAAAKPMLAMSPARRLISAGLPAPSTTIEIGAVRRARESCRARTAAAPARSRPVVAARRACRDAGPAR